MIKLFSRTIVGDTGHLLGDYHIGQSGQSAETRQGFEQFPPRSRWSMSAWFSATVMVRRRDVTMQ